MIQDERGVAGALVHQRQWPGVAAETYALRWITEPGAVRLRFARPTLCMVSGEAGGRAELRRTPEAPVEGEFYGLGALAFVAAGDPVAVFAAEMREAKLSCFQFEAGEAPYATADDAQALATAASRYMFKDDRARTCAALLDGAEPEPAAGRFTASLSQALFASVLELARRTPAGTPPELSGPAFARVTSFIRDQLDRAIKVEDLAHAAGLPTDRFGQAFRDATGLSPRRWQMDARVRTAQRLMVDTPDANLAEIATLSGFADQSHFSRAFLEVVGVTPTAWLHRRP